MGFYVSAGVYVREKDLSNIIPNISTTQAALVGYSEKGDVDEVKMITNTQQFIQEYGKPKPGQYFHYTALAFLENGSRLFCKRVVNGALYGGAKIMQSGYGPNLALVTGSATKTFQPVSGEEILFYVFAKDPGAWNNDVAIKVVNIDSTDYTFDIEVWLEDEDGNYSKVETWTVSRKQQIDGYGRQLFLEDRINGYSSYISVADSGLDDTLLPEAQDTPLNLDGGTNGNPVTDSEIIAGWDKFSNPDEIDVRILLNGGYATVPVQQKMKEIAESRKDCIAILDMPYSELTSVSSMVVWRKTVQNFNSSYTALYAPWVKIYDEFNDKVIEVPPSGYVGSMMAYNDFVADAWWAPAGFNRGLLNVLGLTNVFTQGDRDELYSNQINPLQTFRGEGNVIWGQKTQQVKASALDRVNVRRLLIVLEKAIATALRQFVFEPNNELTRFRVTAMIEEYMNLLAARGAFQSELGDRGYRVVCNTTNNTPATIDRNELHVDVFIKPIRAAEYIQLQAVVTSTGASFEELIAKGVLF